VAFPLLACLALATVILVPSVSAADAPVWSSGDYWRMTNSQNYFELKVSGETTCGGVPVYEGSDGGTATYWRKSDLAFLYLNGCGVELDYFDFPMTSGMTYACTDSTGAFNCRIGAMEKISTRAGSFDSFPIQVEATTGYYVTFAYFAPDVGYLIKIEDPSDPIELTSYRYGNGPTNWALIGAAVIILVVIVVAIVLVVKRAKKKAAERAALAAQMPAYPAAPGYPAYPGYPGATYPTYGTAAGYGTTVPYPGYSSYPTTPSPSYAPGAYYGAPAAAPPGVSVYPPSGRAPVAPASAPAAPKPAGSAYNCSTCGRGIRYISAYSRWYCDNCKKYI